MPSSVGTSTPPSPRCRGEADSMPPLRDARVVHHRARDRASALRPLRDGDPMIILSLFVRRDGAAWGYVLTPSGVEVTRHHARNLYETPGEAYPGEKAAREWELWRAWFLTGDFGTTTLDAMRACGIDQTQRPS